MMKFYKNILDGFLVSISTNVGAVEITESEYKSIIQKIWNKPTDPDGFRYKLRADNLEWELVELPAVDPVEEAVDPVEEAGPEDYESALAEMGVDFSD